MPDDQRPYAVLDIDAQFLATEHLALVGLDVIKEGFVAGPGRRTVDVGGRRPRVAAAGQDEDGKHDR